MGTELYEVREIFTVLCFFICVCVCVCVCVYIYIRRHPEIVERTSQAVTAASSCVSEENIRKWFDEVQEYIR